jgi:3-phytase
MSAARGPNGKGVLVVSSQGDSTYSVYDLDGRHTFLGSFAVRGGASIDAANDTDGLDLGSGSFGSAFPNGLLAVHDGKNDAAGGGSAAGSNLKFVRFDQVFALHPPR